MSKQLLLLVSIVALWGCGQKATAPATPEATLQAYVQHINDGDLEAAAKLVVGADPDADLSYEKRNLKAEEARIENLTVKIDGSRGLAGFDLVADSGESEEGQRVELLKVDGGWLIMPTPNRRRDDSQVFSETAFILATGILTRGRNNFGPTAQPSGKRLELLVDAMRKYLAANGNTFNLDQESLRPALEPYISDPKAFFDDTEEKYPFQFNEKLKGVKLGQISDPANVVMFFVGENGKLQHPFAGSQVFATVSGDVLYRMKEQMESYSWDPK